MRTAQGRTGSRKRHARRRFGLVAGRHQIAFHDGDDVWVMDPDGRDRLRLTTDPAFDCCPAGLRTAPRSSSTRAQRPPLQWAMAAEGTRTSWYRGSVDQDLGYFWQDGQMLVLCGDGADPILTMDVRREPLQPGNNQQQRSRWSADGTQIFYTADHGTHRPLVSMDADGSHRVNLSNQQRLRRRRAPAAQNLPQHLPQRLWRRLPAGISGATATATARSARATTRRCCARSCPEPALPD